MRIELTSIEFNVCELFLKVANLLKEVGNVFSIVGGAVGSHAGYLN